MFGLGILPVINFSMQLFPPSCSLFKTFGTKSLIFVLMGQVSSNISSH